MSLRTYRYKMLEDFPNGEAMAIKEEAMPVIELKKEEVNMALGWSKGGNGAFTSVVEPRKELPAGAYNVYEDANGIKHFYPVEFKSDNIIDLPGLPTEFILKQMEKFWKSKERYQEFGFLQKRGILLYGGPGYGKSSIINLLRQQIINRGGIVLLPKYGFTSLMQGIEHLRRSEPSRPIMTIVEDLETYLESSNGSNAAQVEQLVLSLYDGENQIDNVIHVATTNKPDLLADRFIRRPGRFDLVIGVHAPSRETREAYLVSIVKDGLSDEQKNEILDKTDGLSLAFMREIASSFLVLETPIDEILARVKGHSSQKFTTSKTGFTIGFTGHA